MAGIDSLAFKLPQKKYLQRFAIVVIFLNMENVYVFQNKSDTSKIVAIFWLLVFNN